MKKYVLFIILIIIVIFGIVYFNISQPSWDNVDVFIEEGTLTSTGASIVIRNKNIISTNHEIFANPRCYYIDKKINGEWLTLPEDSYYIQGAYHSDYRHKTNKNLKWESRYGELEPGQYRLRFELGSYNDVSGSAIKLIEFII